MKVIQFMNRDVEIYTQCMQKGVKERLPEGIEYKLLKKDPYGCQIFNDDPRSPSEEIRIRLAIDNPDMVWLDSDIIIRSWPEMNLKGKPYFVGIEGRYAVEYAFFVNGCTAFFEELLDEYHNRCVNKDNYWLQRAMNKRQKRVYYIPEKALIHCVFSKLSRIDKELIGDGYSIIKKEDGYDLKII
jgi:hypothetical protein